MGASGLWKYLIKLLINWPINLTKQANHEIKRPKQIQRTHAGIDNSYLTELINQVNDQT